MRALDGGKTAPGLRDVVPERADRKKQEKRLQDWQDWQD
jgi:hypothetical protein